MCLACAEAHASVPSGVRCLRRACGGQLTGESQQVRALEMKLKRRQLASKDMAIETAQALVTAVGHTKGNNPRHLISEVQDIGRRLEEAAGDGELIVGNICRRVLFMIRDEYATLVTGKNSGEGLSEEKAAIAKQPSLGDVLEGDLALPGADRIWTDDVPQSFKSVVVESIKELVKEIETIKEHVADQAMEHVHANEVILTCGYSSTVLHFLTEVARRHRKFEVVVSEMAPSLEGHAMAQALAKAGIATTVVTDAAIFAVMARVNKVIVGCQAVLANGGITSLTGVHAVAVAAKHYNVPLVVCTGMYKLAPVFPHDQYSFNELRSPADVSKLDPAGGIARR